MKFYIETMNDNGSGMEYNSKEEFLEELSLQIDDCIANGGTYFDTQIDADASCFCNDDDDKTYTAQLLENNVVIIDESTYDSLQEAIEFAQSHGWDEVVDDRTGKTVWNKN